MYKAFNVTKNKSIELQTDTMNHQWFTFDFSWSKEQDHAGIRFGVSILKWNFDFSFYDIRHWDENKNTWKSYPTTKEEIKKEQLEDELYDKQLIWKLINKVTRKN